MIIEAAKSGHTQVVQLLLDYPNSILVTSELAQISSGMNVAPTMMAVSVVPEDGGHGASCEAPTPSPRVPPIGGVTAGDLNDLIHSFLYFYWFIFKVSARIKNNLFELKLLTN